MGYFKYSGVFDFTMFEKMPRLSNPLELFESIIF